MRAGRRVPYTTFSMPPPPSPATRARAPGGHFPTANQNLKTPAGKRKVRSVHYHRVESSEHCRTLVHAEGKTGGKGVEKLGLKAGEEGREGGGGTGNTYATTWAAFTQERRPSTRHTHINKHNNTL
jgi:hypothetical protein